MKSKVVIYGSMRKLTDKQGLALSRFMDTFSGKVEFKSKRK